MTLKLKSGLIPLNRSTLNSTPPLPSFHFLNACSQQVACDCIWSDPAHETQEPYLPDNGFGESLRGGGAICFGMNAISGFSLLFILS